MKTIVLYGHTWLVQAAFELLDAQLRADKITNIALALTDWEIDTQTAHMVRELGGELWFCGTDLRPPVGSTVRWSPMNACRYVLADCKAKLAEKLQKELDEFLGKTRVCTL